MTIKVIKEGVKNWQTVYRGTCHTCKCVVECDKNDGNYVPHSYRGEGDYVAIKCPNCEHGINCYPIKPIPTGCDMRDCNSGFYDR
jgi:hypothetical protein